MIEGVRYVKYKGNERLIEDYNALFFVHKERVMDALRSYCKLEGNSISDFQSCYFAAEIPNKDDEEYIGESGVAFYLDYPAVDKEDEGVVILTHDEFLEVVKRKYGDYIKKYPEKQDKILGRLDLLEKTLPH